MSKIKRITSFGGQSPSAADRKFERLPMQRTAVVTTLDAEFAQVTSYACGIRDLSANGACVLMADMPMEGDKIILVVAPNQISRGSAFFAKVVHVGLVDGEWIRVGVQFFKPPAQLQPLMDQLYAEIAARAGLPVRSRVPDPQVDAMLSSAGRPHRRSA